MNQFIYTNAKKLLLNGGLDLDSDTLKLALVQDTYTPDVSGHTAWSDVSANEIAEAGGYTAGGASIAGLVATADNVNDEGMLDCNDVNLANITATGLQYLILYASKTDNPLVACCNLETPVDLAGDVLNVVIHANGLIRML